jgi:uncharacterized protein
MAKIDNDDVSNNSGNPTFEEIVAARISRRGFLGGGLAAAAAFSFSGVSALLRSVPASAQAIGQASLAPLLSFQGIPADADTVVVPPGYSARVFVAWGDPVSNGPEFKQDASNSAADQAQQWGMHNDGLIYFPIKGSTHGLLVQNNEYTDDGLLFPDGVANWNEEKPTSQSMRMGSRLSKSSIKAANGGWCARQDTGGGSPPRRQLRSAGQRLETTV